MRSKVAQRILDETPEDVKIFTAWYAEIIVRINELLKEKRITQKSLAESMGKKPSEISKWLNGEHNFTLRSLSKIQAELGEPILFIPQATFFRSGASSQQCMIVHRNVISQTYTGFSEKARIESEQVEYCQPA